VRDRLPCETTIVARLHPLVGQRLVAREARHDHGELSVVVVLPDGSPAFLPVTFTDILGGSSEKSSGDSLLSVDGARRLRALLTVALAKSGPSRSSSPRPWKVVRHRPGADPFRRCAEVFSAHSTEAAAVRACERHRAKLLAAIGQAEAGRWSISVLCDHAGVVTQPGMA
ncbi:MAG: hypothetical protein ABSA14_15575, partial [Acidimicrobiales bacterium]